MADLVFEKDGHVALLKLNRPERMNAISVEMLGLLGESLQEIDDDHDIRVIVLTGEGRGFCSGLDMKDATAGKGIGGSGTLSAGGGASHISTREIPTVTLHRIDVPIICALNGAAAGYGLDLALGCDMRIMSDTAKLLPGFARRGIIPESGGTWYLPRLIGWAKACEIGFMAEDIDAGKALELGLVNKVVPGDQVLQATMDWAARIAQNAPLGVRAMKRLYRHGLTEDFESHTHHVLMQLLLLFRSDDFREGMTSFMEKREPSFTGK